MKKGMLIVATCLMALNGYSQDWGWGDSGGSGSGSGGSSSSGSSSSGSTGTSSGAGSGTGAGAGSGAGTTPTLAVPTIGTHYDDAPAFHRETPFTTNDGRPGIDDAVVVPYPFLREADLKFRRRIWRRIDCRQKMNRSFTWPKNPVTQIIYEAATKGLVRGYWTDSLNRVKTPEDCYKEGSKLVVTQIQNWRNPEDNEDLVDTAYYDIFKWEKIVRFEIMEDWLFDYKHSELRPRIIAIAPMYEEKFPNGQTYELPLFWIKMDDLRPTLAKSEVFNRYNDVMRISWDDLFNHYRLFDSYIVKTTDWDDRYLSMRTEFQQDPIAMLLEAENIKNDLFIFEHDLWEF
jgi:gliding motility associated protien GldN